jgi:hypothetical protein
MNVVCVHCGALHWLSERLEQSSVSSPVFSSCCHHNKDLDPLPQPSQRYTDLFTSDSADAKQFRDNIQQYNNALAFTSFTTNMANVNAGGGGPQVWYTIYGEDRGPPRLNFAYFTYHILTLSYYNTSAASFLLPEAVT